MKQFLGGLVGTKEPGNETADDQDAVSAPPKASTNAPSVVSAPAPLQSAASDDVAPAVTPSEEPLAEPSTDTSAVKPAVVPASAPSTTVDVVKSAVEQTTKTSDDVDEDKTNEVDAKRPATTDATSTEAKGGEARLAATELSSVLDKSRSKESLEALRVDLASMRRRLNASQEHLVMVRATVNRFIQDASPEFVAAWEVTESTINSAMELLNKDLPESTNTTTNAVRRGKAYRQNKQRNPQQQPNAWKQQPTGSRPHMGEGFDWSHWAAQQQYQMMPAPQGQQVGGIAGQKRRQGRRSKQQPTGDDSQHAAPDGQRQTAGQVNAASKIRDELRRATTVAELEAALTKARQNKMKHEAFLAQKKLNKLKPPVSVAEKVVPEASADVKASDTTGNTTEGSSSKPAEVSAPNKE